ncbi:hypothetical protein ACFX2H_013421 [Malus domestica]
MRGVGLLLGPHQHTTCLAVMEPEVPSSPSEFPWSYVKVHAYVGGTSVREDQRILQRFRLGCFLLLPSKVQVGVFSATMPPEALEITRKFMNKPVRILLKRTDMGEGCRRSFHVRRWLVWSARAW